MRSLGNLTREMSRVLGAGLLAGLMGVGAAYAETKLRIAATGLQGDVLSAPLEKWAEWVNQRSEGDLDLQVFNQSLGVEAQVLPSVVNGTVDAAQIVNGNLAGFTNAFLPYDLPFMFREYDNALDVLSSPVGQKLIAQFEEDVGVKYLFAISNGVGRDIQTNPRPLKVPDDIRGLKIRVLNSPVDLATFQAWGANPTPLESSQMYSALQQGVVDGVQQSLPYVLTVKYYEVLKYNVRLDYQAAVQIVYMNKAKFDGLTTEQQKILLEEGKKAEDWSRQYAGRLAHEVAQELAALGFENYQPTPDEYALWIKDREKIWDDVAARLGDKLDLEVAKEIYAAQEAK